MSARNYLIVGFGIAGLALWQKLQQRQASVYVVDAPDSTAASRVAPGVVNPLAGRRLSPSWKVDEQLPVALSFYREMEALLGKRFFDALPIVRIIKDEEQRTYLEKRLKDPKAAQYIGQEHSPGSWKLLKDPYGSFEATISGYVRVGELCNAVKERLHEQGQLEVGRLELNEIELDDNGATWKNRRFDTVVFCQGWRSQENPWFAHLPYTPAKGQMLTLRSLRPVPDFPKAIVNRSKWILPIDEHTFRAGSTYSWDRFDGAPTAAARREILARIKEFTDVEFEVTHEEAGVRPVLKDRKPVLGRHPEHRQLAIFNGLASKGVLMAPWLAEMMAAHLEDNKPLAPEVDVARFG